MMDSLSSTCILNNDKAPKKTIQHGAEQISRCISYRESSTLIKSCIFCLMASLSASLGGS